MIYVTVHRVVAQRGGRQGINRYYYHRPEPAPRTPEGMIDPRPIAGGEGETGELIAVDTEVRPGGNRVSEFLDIVLEVPSPDPLRRALQEIEQRFASVSFPIVETLPDIGLVFNLDDRVRPLARQELIFLCNKALPWLERPPQKTLRQT
ncbi:MAG TPA: hypothetical protein VGI39_38885, partial [Polyangiaceae bacterium]